MAWAGGVWDGTFGTDTTNINGGMITYYDRKFLKRAINTLRFAPFAQMRDIPKNNGKIIDFFRYNNIATSISGRNLTEGTNPAPTLITGQDISATLEEWGAFSQHSSLVSNTHLDRKLAGVSTLWGEDAANTMDLLAQMEVAANGAYPFRADADSTYEYAGVVDLATSTTVTDATLETNTDYGDANDDLNQSVMIMTSGTSYGQQRACTDYVASGGVVTVSPAWDITPVAGDTYWVTSADTTLATSEILTTTNIRRAVTQLRTNKAMTIDGDFYVGFLSPDTESELMADTDWKNVQTYRDLPAIRQSGLFRGEVGQWGGVRFVRTTQPFRFPQAAIGTAGSASGVGANNPGTTYTNYAADGAVHSTIILGMEAFGSTTLKGNNSVKPGMIIKNPGPSDTSNPLNMFSTVGWYVPYIAKALNPMFAVQIWSVS